MHRSRLHCFGHIQSLLSVLLLLVVTSVNASRLQNRATAEDSSIYETRFPGVTWDHANWKLTTTELDQGHYQSRVTVANGYHGINVAALGPFFEVDTPVAGDNINGWPLFGRRQTFATVGGFWDSQPTTNGSNYPWLYQYGWDSAISGIPHWAGIVVDLGGTNVLDASTNSSTISNFTSTLDMKNGLMNWAYTWSPRGRGSFNITYQMFAHKEHINQGFVALNITASQNTNLTIANVLNGDCAVRTSNPQKGVDAGIIYTSVQPNGIRNITAFIYAGLTIGGARIRAIDQGVWDRPYVGNNESSIATGVHVTLQAGQTATFIKYIGIASTDGYAQPRMVAREAALSARRTGYQAALRTHSEEWHRLFPSTSVDDFSYPENGTLPDDEYIIEAAITAVANPYHMLQNTISENAIVASGNASVNSHSIAVGGLGSDSYAGQIFWDAEIWMQPGLVVTFPYSGRGIANYRVERYPQALANSQTSYQSSKNDTTFSSNAAIYPWTSGRKGNCTATGPCFDYEYHINGDIAQEFANYWISSGDTEYFRSELFPIYDSMATFYSEVLERNGSKWALTNMTDPDEYANHVDNGGFTMPLIANTLTYANMFRSMFNQTPNETWSSQAENVLIGRDEEANIILEYTGMNGSINVKQADVILVTFPLSYTGENYTTEDSLSDLDYYAAKQTADGPGMTYAIFSIIANKVSPSGCSSYTYQQYSEHPYMRAPWFQFSEQLVDNYQENGGTHPAYPFLTGHGGANQVILFGYLGLRLIPDWNLHIDPSLPPQIPQIRYRTFHWHGWPINAFSNQTHTILSRNTSITPAEGARPNSTYATEPIPVLVGSLTSNTTSYLLPQNGSITIPNRQPGLIKTTPNNAAQCRHVTSQNEFIPGQFPIAAVDGASSTKWQPTFANETASITVSLPLGHRVIGFSFDWAQAPPYNYSITFHNTSNISNSAAVETVTEEVEISNPWNVTEILSIVPVEANLTSFNLSDDQVVYTARYATLTIWGSLYNGSLTAQNMSGDGATVAEWNVIVEDDGSGSAGVSARDLERRGEVDVNFLKREREREVELWLGRAGRYNRMKRRGYSG